MEKILSIVQTINRTWIKMEDGNWHNISITDTGKVYINGSIVCKDIKSTGCSNWGKHKKIESRFEILDL